MRWLHEWSYRHFRVLWDIGPRQELMGLVDSAGTSSSARKSDRKFILFSFLFDGTRD
jgi:hypothetical protein